MIWAAAGRLFAPGQSQRILREAGIPEDRRGVSGRILSPYPDGRELGYRAVVIRTEDITERQWELLYGQLSEARRQKADRIHLLAHRRESIAAGALLEWLLRQQEKNPPSVRQRQWKAVSHRSGWRTENRGIFSITHTKGAGRGGCGRGAGGTGRGADPLSR